MGSARRREWCGTVAAAVLAAVVAVVWPELVGALGCAFGAAALRKAG
jgi:hypothetical protein